MHRHRVGKIQILIGIAFLIFTIGFSIYAINHVIGTLTRIAAIETDTWSDVEAGNSTRAHVISSLNVNANVTLWSVYTVIFSAVIMVLLSIMLILQGLANLAPKPK